MALGHSIVKFKHIKLVVAVNGIHLKRKYKGIMFIIAFLDGNEQIFHLAFSVGDIESESSCT